jgi:isocitrate/isopropylmalate dehydrogenase
MLLNLTALPGDGVGPEVTDEAVRVLETIAEVFGHQLSVTRKPVGGAALLSSKDPLPADTLQSCLASGAVLLGAVGGPSFDNFPSHLRPESGLLRLRRELGVFANLRPALCFAALEDCSPLRAEVVRGTDVLIVRELLGGIYFGEPRSTQGAPGNRVAIDTMRYGEPEIERIARVAFELARSRRRKVTSVDKANVLDCSRLWREVVTQVGQQYSDVKLSHMYVDSAAMALVARPADFDVVLTENMLATSYPTWRAPWWDRWECWARPALAGPSAFMSQCMAPRLTSPGKALPIRWARFCRLQCCCAIPSSLKPKRPALSRRWPRCWHRDPEPKIWPGRERAFLVHRQWDRELLLRCGSVPSLRARKQPVDRAPKLKFCGWISTKFFASTGCIPDRRE